MFFTIPSTMSTDAASFWARQFVISSALSAKTLNSMSKLIDLNARAMQDAWTNSNIATQQMLSSDPSGATQQTQHAIDAARAYGREVAGLACEMRTVYTHHLQGNIASASAHIDARLDELARRAPEAPGGVINIMRTTLGNVQKGYDQAVMTSEQAALAMVDMVDVRSQPFATQTAPEGARGTAH